MQLPTFQTLDNINNCIKEASMELLPLDLREGLSKLYTQDGTSDPTVHVKYFTPDSAWTWYATEGQPDEDDFRFFGYVIGLEREWGYFMLSELEAARGPLGLPIERDLHFQPAPLSEVLRRDYQKQAS